MSLVTLVIEPAHRSVATDDRAVSRIDYCSIEMREDLDPARSGRCARALAPWGSAPTECVVQHTDRWRCHGEVRDGSQSTRGFRSDQVPASTRGYGIARAARARHRYG